MPRANIYIDGYNLYYGALKGSPYKWLDLRQLSQLLLKPGIQIGSIRYFTARVDDRANSPGSRDRQNTYLRALATLPELTIDFGQFRTHRRTFPRADGQGFVEVVRTEERALTSILRHAS